MTSKLTVQDLLDQPFVIHSLNNYTNIGLTSFADHLALEPDQIQKLIRVEHHQLIEKLAIAGVDYAELGNALVPKPGRYEAAFIFDSTLVENGMYGYSFAENWIPVLRQHGPDKTVIRVGDILNLPREFVWEQFERLLVGVRDFPLLHTEQYFVVYMTNLSQGQLGAIHKALTRSANGYVGNIDCSTWNPLKAGMYLPQVGLRLRDVIITDMDDGGNANQVGYPFNESGFQVLGVLQDLYGLFLSHRLDNGVPAWADKDSAMSLIALGGTREPATTTTIEIDESRIEYLGGQHLNSLAGAGLTGLDADSLADVIKRKLENGLIYNLRFTLGARGGVFAPELDAMLYSVQVEFPDANGGVKRYQVGLKYSPHKHSSEIVTFY